MFEERIEFHIWAIILCSYCIYLCLYYLFIIAPVALEIHITTKYYKIHIKIYQDDIKWMKNSYCLMAVYIKCRNTNRCWTFLFHSLCCYCCFRCHVCQNVNKWNPMFGWCSNFIFYTEKNSFKPTSWLFLFPCIEWSFNYYKIIFY